MWLAIASNWKPIAIGLLVLGVLGASFGMGWHFGSESSHLALVQSQLKAAQTDAQQSHAALVLTQAAVTKQAGIVDAYNALKDSPDPIGLNVVERVRYLATACPSVFSAPPGTSGATTASAVPAGSGSAQHLSELVGAATEACSADARQLNALVAITKE